MSTRRKLVRLLVAAVALLGVLPAAGAALVLGARPAHAQADWSAWSQTATLAVHDNATTALPSGYTVTLVLDTGSLQSQGLLRTDAADLRISYVGGGGDVELDRLAVAVGADTTTVTFRTQAAIAVGGTDLGYRLHYGNPSAGSPPAIPANVWAYYDDFQDGTATGWLTKGSWAVVADGSNYVLRYTGGGAAWALAYVPLAGLSNVDCVARVRATASTNWIGLAFRIVDNDDFLTFYESKDVSQFKYAQIVNDHHNIVVSPPDTMLADTWYRIHLQAIGTTVRARMWPDGSAEPGSWPISQTDATYESATNIGATLYNHSTVADWDDFQVRELVDTEPTVAVVAATYTLTVATVGSGTVSVSPNQRPTTSATWSR